MDAERALKIVQAVLTPRGHQVALAGGYAMLAYGRVRMTVDLDLVVPLAAQPELISALEAAGYRTLHKSEGYSNHMHSDRGLGRLDFIYVDSGTAQKLFGAATLVTLPGSSAVALLPRAEHLAAMKVQALKNDRSRRLTDLADVEHLLSLPNVDREEIHGYFQRAGLDEDWNELTAQR